ncbi:MAG: hypothetical protein QUS35_03520 [bacterium]|nr:hypothetical protein [bacterium]
MFKVQRDKVKLVAISWVLVLLLGFRPAAGQFKPRLPEGWQVAGKSDYAEEDIRFFNDALPNHAYADFDGDDRKDHVLLLIQREESRYGLFVVPGSGGRILKIEEMPLSRRDRKIRAGLSLVKPGLYLTACGRGFWDCGPDEPAELELTRNGIYFFIFEGSCSIYYWNDHTLRYDRITVSE